MKLIHNTGTDRVIDIIRPHLKSDGQLDCVTPTLSLFAFAELRDALAALKKVQLILPQDDGALEFLGGDGDRPARNRLQSRWLALQCAKWVNDKVELRRALGPVPQGAAVLRNAQASPEQVVLGSFAFSTDGMGLTPGNPLSLIQASESSEEAGQLSRWFDQQWAALSTRPDTRSTLIQALGAMGEQRDPFTLYALMLHHLFRDSGNEMDEETIVKSATGIRNTVV